MAKDKSLGTVHVVVSGDAAAADPTLSKKLDTLLTLVQQLRLEQQQMANETRTALDVLKTDFAAIKAAVQNLESTATGLVAQIADLKTRLDAGGTADATILADMNTLHTDAQALVAEIGAATTAANPPA